MKKSILKVMLGSIIVEAVLVCIFILMGDFNEVSWRSLGSVATIFYCSLPCLCYAKIYDNEKYKGLAIFGAIVACICALTSILVIWELIETDITIFKVNIIVETLMWALAIISWILSIDSVNDIVKRFKTISISLTSLLSLFIIINTLLGEFPEGFLARLYWVIIVLTVGSWICMSILTRIYRKELEKSSKQDNISKPNGNIPVQNVAETKESNEQEPVKEENQETKQV